MISSLLFSFIAVQNGHLWSRLATSWVQISLVKIWHIFSTPELLDQNLLVKNVSCFSVDNFSWVTRVQHSKINMPLLIWLHYNLSSTSEWFLVNHILFSWGEKCGRKCYCVIPETTLNKNEFSEITAFI